MTTARLHKRYQPTGPTIRARYLLLHVVLGASVYYAVWSVIVGH